MLSTMNTERIHILPDNFRETDVRDGQGPARCGAMAPVHEMLPPGFTSRFQVEARRPDQNIRMCPGCQPETLHIRGSGKWLRVTLPGRRAGEILCRAKATPTAFTLKGGLDWGTHMELKRDLRTCHRCLEIYMTAFKLAELMEKSIHRHELNTARRAGEFNAGPRRWNQRLVRIKYGLHPDWGQIGPFKFGEHRNWRRKRNRDEIRAKRNPGRPAPERPVWRAYAEAIARMEEKNVTG